MLMVIMMMMIIIMRTKANLLPVTLSLTQSWRVQVTEDTAGAEGHRVGGGLEAAGQAGARRPLPLEPAPQLGALDLPEDPHAGPVIIVTRDTLPPPHTWLVFCYCSSA